MNEDIQYNKDDLKNHKGICCIIWNHNRDKILMQDHVKFNFWTIPVGKVDDGDTLNNTIKKEMKEELNINIKKFKEIINWKEYYNRFDKIIEVHLFLYEIISYQGSIKNNEPKKHRSFEWMTIDEIKKLNKISHGTEQFLKCL